MSKNKAWLAFVAYSGATGIWVLSYLVNGGTWRLVFAALCTVGVGLAIRELVKR